MRLRTFRRAFLGSAVVLLILCCSPQMLCAQGNPPTYTPTKYLVIQREFTKPGRDGSSHQATEAAYMRAAAAGKAPFHYVAFTSLSGPNRALFVSGYDSMEAVEAERKATSAALEASLDKAMVSDGDQLSATDSSVWTVDPELSQNTNGPRIGSRFMIIREYVVKPGHSGEWEQLVKSVMDGYKKADVGAHWSTYRMVFGGSGGPTYLILTSVKSMNEVDQMFSGDPKFEQAMGEDGLKRLDALEASCVESAKINMFAIDPKMSIPTDEMIKAEPDFWRPKSMASSARKTAAKPASASGQ